MNAASAAIASTSDTVTKNDHLKAADTMFNLLDINHDHKLTLTDFIALDTDRNEKITPDEFRGALRGKGSTLTTTTSTTGGGAGVSGGGRTTTTSFIKGFTSSTAMIIATEIGDKTFFIAAVLSMRHSRINVFAGSILALVCMTILSTMMGLILPSILPRQYTHIIGGILFLYFGIKLIYDSRSMSDRVSDELEEVEEELGCNSKKNDLSFQDDDDDDDNDDYDDGYNGGGGDNGDRHGNDLEGGTTRDKKDKTTSASATKKHKQRSSSPPTKNVFLQAFLLTFLAEWGDRSQIATIALAAAKDPYGVTVGACFGHSLCTGLAVVGGRMLASRISEKTVSFWGGVIFLCFGVHALVFEV